MTENDIIEFVSAMPGVETLTAGPENGAPEAAWGDTFFFYDPDGTPADRRLPFATVVVKDYKGFDEASRLDRAGVFRLNIAVGRDGFRRVLGYPPAEHAGRHALIDYAVLDRPLPHPSYAAQGWVCFLNPGERTGGQARALLEEAHARAVARYRPNSRR